jgi:erythromycin esterase-like protein
VRPSAPGRLERLCHDTAIARFLVDFSRHPGLSALLAEPRLQRFIGVVYRPETEMVSHYADAAPSRQYDAWVWFDETSAVTPLGRASGEAAGAETWPFGT